MAASPTSKHIVVTVSAHVVDIPDPASGGSDTIARGPAFYTDSRHCLPCFNIAAAEAAVSAGTASASELAAVQGCGAALNADLPTMLADATASILKQAAGW